jgi:hypothetical protein
MLKADRLMTRDADRNAMSFSNLCQIGPFQTGPYQTLSDLTLSDLTP